MKVLGVSGSPIENSNTDRALQVALDATGLETEFVKLTDYRIEPCRACLGCLHTARCVINDDGNLLAQKALEAQGLIIAGFTPYSTIDARTKAFIERLYPLRHQHGCMVGKPGGAIVTSCIIDQHDKLPPACQIGIDAIQYYMMEEGMEYLGAVKIEGNVPCMKCGNGDSCKMSAVTMIHGPEATVDSVGIRRFEEQHMAVDAAADLGRRIGEYLKCA